MEIICFFAGTAFFYFKTIYPIGLFLLSLYFRPQWSYCIWFLAAVVWCQLHQFQMAARHMPSVPSIKQAVIEGTVVSLPVKQNQKVQFEFLAQQLNQQPIHTKLLLACYQYCPSIAAGQYWRFTVKLKRPYNLANPGGFDQVNWLATRHIFWTGYLRRGPHHHVTQKDQHFSLIVWRQYLAQALSRHFKDNQILGIVEALALGVTNHIDPSAWDLFRRTGTTHLMVISGSHIAMIAGLFYSLIKWIWARSPWTLRLPAPKLAAVGAMVLATIYALLAGFEVPTQRALIVCFIMFLQQLIPQRFTVWQAWRYALFLVLLWEPHAIRQIGFYLSFIAVAILILVNQRFSLGKISKVVVMQMACMLGLMPITLFCFGYCSINSLVANFIAIPWVGFLLVPLSLLMTLGAHFSLWQGLVWGVEKLIVYLLFYLQWIDHFQQWNFELTWTHLYTPMALLVALFGAVTLTIKPLWPVLFLLLSSSFITGGLRLRTGTVRLDVLDVAQGLAVVVRTAQHILIYDTGMKQYRGNDMGKMVIIPYLNTLGIRQLDKVIISHPDLDHRGGLVSLQQKYAIRSLVVDDPAFYHAGRSCHRYPSWRWDGVEFQFLPLPRHLGSRNNHSCILRINNGTHQVLLTGDIEKPAEDYLRQHAKNLLPSSVLVVPHHASKTSSSAKFVAAVAPKIAIASYGIDNRYHFPHQQTLNTYARYHIPVFDTAHCGMISVTLQNHAVITPECYTRRA